MQSRRKRTSAGTAGSPPRAAQAKPDFLLALPAGLGLVLSAFLWFAGGGGETALCPAGSACQVVQTSRYAALLGFPLPVFGVAYYGAVLALAVKGLRPDRRWLWALPVAAGGAAASGVFTGVQQFVLQALCPPCLVSAALSATVLALVLVRRPPHAAGWAWMRGAGAAVASVVFIAGAYALPTQQGTEYAYKEGLARHLSASGVKFYGAFWCRFCEEQKRMFGAAAIHLPYVECDPRSPEWRPGVCERAGVRAYPTWDIGGRRFEGMIPLADLARLSGYSPPR